MSEGHTPTQRRWLMILLIKPHLQSVGLETETRNPYISDMAKHAPNDPWNVGHWTQDGAFHRVHLIDRGVEITDQFILRVNGKIIAHGLPRAYMEALFHDHVKRMKAT